MCPKKKAQENEVPLQIDQSYITGRAWCSSCLAARPTASAHVQDLNLNLGRMTAPLSAFD